jgi:hypothetical protein
VDESFQQIEVHLVAASKRRQWMLRDVSEVSTIMIACRKEDALAAVWEIKNIEKTEVKADVVEVHKESDKTGFYDVRGHFAGIPWHNRFSYELNDKGFHSLETNPPASGPRIQGGFIVDEIGEHACKITHYEQYVLPKWAVPLKPLVQMYLRWSMRKELMDLREMILADADKVLA